MVNETILAVIIAFAVSAALCPIVIPFLHKLKFGQQVREDGPQAHLKKQGTPTMGGLIILSSIVITSLFYMKDYPRIIPVLFMTVGFGIIGFLDDYEKLKKKQNLGLTAGKKILLQLAAAVAFIFLMRRFGYVALDSLYIPFWNTTVAISEPLYVIFAAFVIVGTVNAVNITDGIDGLAGSVTVPVGLFFTVLAIWWQGYEQLGIYAAALVGGILGFLIYNFHPAKVFMGDTGSLFLGGTVAALAFAYDMPLVLIPVGFVYICETLSDILQVIYFKATHGKRLFKMAPLHHHFELCGWSETRVVAVFSIVTAILCLVAYMGL